MKIFDQTMNTLENSLQYSTTKNKTISNNIANIDTPNYKAQDVSFRSMLQDASENLQLKNTNNQHFKKTTNNSPHVITTKNNATYNHNGNNVDIDKEMADLAENQLHYRSLVDRLNGKFQTIQNVVRGGK